MRVEDFDLGVGVGAAVGARGEARGRGGGVEQVVGDVFEGAKVGERALAFAVAEECVGGVEAADAAGEAGAFGADGVVAEVEGVGARV